MALNYSRSPLFSSHLYDENMILPFGILNGYRNEGVWDKSGENSTMCRHVNLEQDQEKNYAFFTADSDSEDMVNLLPSDPFGMCINTNFTAFTGFLEDLEVHCDGYIKSNTSNTCQNGCNSYDSWDFFPSTFNLIERSNSADDISFIPHDFLDSIKRGMEAEQDILATKFLQACEMFKNMGSVEESDKISACILNGREFEQTSFVKGGPHEAFSFVLSYLGLKDLLSVERVCKSLFFSVRNDPWLWINIHIDHPLSKRITDDIVVKLAWRAQGKLQCLSLIECTKVSDDCLRFILEKSPQLSKLYVPGCTRISIACLVEIIRAFNSRNNVGGIKHLKIGGIYGVEHEHFKELKLLLGVDGDNCRTPSRQYFYHCGKFYLRYEDDRVLDIEMCPRCEKYRLVYDCPSERCSQSCKACTLCVARCSKCGRCVNDTEYEETFCLEILCLDCFNYHESMHREDDSNTPPNERE